MRGWVKNITALFRPNEHREILCIINFVVRTNMDWNNLFPLDNKFDGESITERDRYGRETFQFSL